MAEFQGIRVIGSMQVATPTVSYSYITNRVTMYCPTLGATIYYNRYRGDAFDPPEQPDIPTTQSAVYTSFLLANPSNYYWYKAKAWLPGKTPSQVGQWQGIT